MPHQDYYRQHPELIESAFHYYHDMDFMGFHFTISEMLTGNELEAVEHYFSGYGKPLPFRPDNCYMLIAGLPQEVYHDVYGWQVPQAYEFFLKQYKTYTDELLARFDCVGISIIHLFDGKKRYVTLFSPNGDENACAEAIAQRVDAFLQRQYEALLFKGPSPYVHITVLSRRIVRYEDISETFAEMQRIASLAYFFPEHCVVREGQCDGQPLARELVAEDLHHLRDALMFGDASAARDAVRTALLTRVRPGYSFEHLNAVLARMSEAFDFLRVTYALSKETGWDDPFQKRYATIYALTDAVCAAAESLCAEMRAVRPIASRAVADAVHTIRARFSSPELNVAAVAAHARITPNYLNAVFKACVGMTPGEFLANVRMEEAERLLARTGLRIGDVARRVGVPDARYFSRFFKKKAGLSPQAYRLLRQAADERERDAKPDASQPESERTGSL